MNKPIKLKRIDQLSRKASRTSFAYKDDVLHTHLLSLLRNDGITDMYDSTRRGLANNLHFLIMRDMYDAVATQRVIPDCIGLLYQYDKLKKRHRAKLRITKTVGDQSRIDEGSVSIVGERIEYQSQALESLRKTVEGAVYSTI